jgi:hypothetical protein
MREVAEAVKASRGVCVARRRRSAQDAARLRCYVGFVLWERPMISCKLEQVGGRVVLVLDDDALTVLNARVGDNVYLETGGGVVRITERETWVEDPHARGRAFLRRYQRTLDRLA